MSGGQQGGQHAGARSTERDVAGAVGRYRAEHGLDAAIPAVVSEAARRVPAFAARLEQADVAPDQVRSTADLARLPIITKDDMIGLQAADPPMAGLVAPDADVVRVFQSPGPLYEPQVAGSDSWRWGQALHALGLGPSDLVLNCFGYHLSPAGAMMEQGALAVGARVVPAGIGNQDLQVRAISDLGVTAYTGLPSYLHALIERFDAADLNPDTWTLTRAMVTAEPMSPQLRSDLQKRVPHVQMTYGTGETGLLGFEVGDGEGLVPARGVLIDICDLETGEPVTDESEGQVVVTLLRPDYPMVRFGTGDLSGWAVASDGSLRLRGVLGRVGAAIKVKGMFLHPAQVSAALDGVAGVRAYLMIVGRDGHTDTLRCEVVADDGTDHAAVADTVAQRVRDSLRFRVEVTVVAGESDLTGGDGGVLVDQRD